MFAGIQQWFAQPFSASMNAGKWFLFIGLVIVILAAWSIITKHLMDA